jgi:hypothetical protein
LVRSRLLIGAALAVALCAPLRSAYAIRIAVAPLQGKNSPICTHAVAEVLEEMGDIEPWRSAHRAPTTWEALSKWLASRGNEIHADVVVLGLVAGPRMILEAYDPNKVKLVGLKRLVTPKRCKFTPASKALVIDWMRSVVAALSGSPGDAALALEDARAAELDKQTSLARTATKTATATTVVEREHIEAPPAIVPEQTPPPVISAELELGFVSHSFAYTNARTPNLQEIDVEGMMAPGIRIEARPLAPLEKPALEPLFVRAYYQTTAYARSERAGGPKYPTDFTDAGASIGYRWVGTDWMLGISPHAGLHHTMFRLRPARNGSREDQIPNVSYESIELGGDVDVPIKDWIRGILGGSYLVVLSGGDVFSSAYFPAGSAIGFQIEGGLRFDLLPSISVVVLGTYLHYSLSLNTSLASRRIADSADDDSLSVRGGIRFDY